MRLHSDRGGEFSFNLLREFFHGEGITQSFTLPASPQQNGIAERRIGLVMEVSRTSMIHVATPHFIWLFEVRYTAHQLNHWPRVSLPETSPTLRLMGEVGDASVFRFYHPTSRRVLPSQNVTFDESVPFYRLFPYCSAPLPPPPIFLAPGPPPVDPLPPHGPAPLGVSQVDPLPGIVPVKVAGDSGAARGAPSGGVEPGVAGPGGAESEGAGSGGAKRGGAEPADAEPGGAEPAGVEPGGAEYEGAESGGAEPAGVDPGGAESGGTKPRGATSSGGPAVTLPEPLSPLQLREWLVQCSRLQSGAAGAGDTGAGGTRVTFGAGGTGGTTAACPGGARTRGPGSAGTGGVGGAGAGAGDPAEPGCAGAGAIGPGAGGGGTSTGGAGVGAGDPRAGGAPASPVPIPSPYTEQTGGLTERRAPASRPSSPDRPACCASCPRPPPVPGTHAMALRPSSVPLCVPLPPPPKSSLPTVPDPSSDIVRAASPSVSRLLATVVTDPSFESAAASALVVELVAFAAACRLDYATVLIAESESASPPSVGGECALGTDVLEDTQEDFECLAAAVPHFASMLLAPEGDPDAPDIPTPRSYAEAIAGFSQRQGVDYFQTFPPTPKMTTLWVLLHVAAQRDYELHSLDFSTAFLQASLHEEIWLRRPPGFTESFSAGTQWSLRRPVYGLRQAPREWHDTLMITLAALGFTPSTADPSPFLRTDTWLSPFYVLVYVDDLVFASDNTKALTLVKSELQKRHTFTDLGELCQTYVCTFL
ncbi:unnamed protein product [Closterium sp. NIES-53]